MTTVGPAPDTHAKFSADAIPGERLQRLKQRRKRVREEMIAVLILVIALAATVAVLAMQWLESGPSPASALTAPAAYTILGGPI